MSKNILILGGAGYVGGTTVDYLLSKKYSVTVYDNLLYEQRYLKEVDFVFGDIRDISKVKEVISKRKFNVIVIMAALVGDPACSIDVELANAINCEAVKKICNEVDNKIHIIFLSTCSVYGNQNELLDELSPTNPLSVYAKTKLEAEQYVKKCNGTIFRLGTVYGVGDTYSRLRLDLVVNVLVMRAIYDRKIHIFGGQQWRPLICVKDIAGYIEEAISKDIRGTFILSHENVTMRNLGERTVEMFPETEIEYTDILFEDARNYRVDNSKSIQNFKYITKHTLEKEMWLLASIFKQNRIKNVKDTIYHNGNYLKSVL